jgi:hypothetical protein
MYLVFAVFTYAEVEEGREENEVLQGQELQRHPEHVVHLDREHIQLNI